MVLTSVISGVVFVGLAAELLVWDFWLLLPWYLTLYLVGSFIPAAAPRAPYDIRLTLAVFSLLMTLSTVLILLRPPAGVLSITATVLPALAAMTLLASATLGWELNGQGLLARAAPWLLGVYLCHPGWLLLWQQFMRPETSPWQVWLPLTLLFVSTMAFATSAILLRIPGLRSII